jgi:exodeoxyribonuclease V gamma subunit
MLPMRSIPFQAVCLLGLNDGVFPKTDRHPPFDLLGEGFRPGDRSKRGDDRYQFLEALLSARKYLYLSHVGQSIRSDSVIPPSVLITELVEALQLSYGIEDPVQRHPLQPFSARYFHGSSLFSYDDHNCELAKALTHPPQTQIPEPWWSGALPDDHNRTVTIADLLSFFAHPQKWFVRNRLGIRLDTETELPGENELFALDSLDSYLINQELVQACLDQTTEAPTTTLARLKAQGRWMLGTPGQMAFDRQLPEVAAFAGKIQTKNMGQGLPDLPIDLQVGEYRLLGQLTGLHENGIILARYSKCKGKDLLKAWISHLLLAAATSAPAATQLLTKDLDLCFPHCTAPLLRLGELMAIYRAGYSSPSPLLVEPAWIYIQQQNKKRSTKSPLEAATESFTYSREQGYEPEWQLLYGGCDPHTLLGPEFERLCEEFLGPIWSETTDNTSPDGEQNS